MNRAFLTKVRSKLNQKRRDWLAYRHWTQALKSDPLFKLANVERGLLPRPTTTTSPQQRIEIAARVAAAYRAAVQAPRAAEPVYRPSNEWLPIYRAKLGPLIAGLQAANAADIRSLLDGFFRSSISVGLAGLAVDMRKTFFDRAPTRVAKTRLLIDMLYRFRHLQELVPGVKAAELGVADVGDPYGMLIDGCFVRSGADYQYYYAHRVANLLPRDGHAVVAELGGGTGGFGYFLATLRPRAVTYLNLDLPEVLAISSYQLLNLFPDRKILLYGESRSCDSRTLEQYDMALLPSFCVEDLPNDSVDVAFNSYSLAEMDEPTIANYTAQLSRVARGAILHVNHVSRARVSADRFVFDNQRFELRERRRALWNLGRDLECDEYEFLYTRRS